MKPRRRWIFPTVLALLLISACVGVARAAEGSEPDPAETPVGILFRWLNFLLVFGAAAYLIAKKAPGWARGRAEAISQAIIEAAAAKSQAEHQLRDAEDKLKRVGQEIAELRAAAQHESVAEAHRLRAATWDEIDRIARAAQAEIEAAERAARMELKALAARLAVERASALLERQLTPRAQASLFRSFVDSLPRSAN